MNIAGNNNSRDILTVTLQCNPQHSCESPSYGDFQRRHSGVDSPRWSHEPSKCSEQCWQQIRFNDNRKIVRKKITILFSRQKTDNILLLLDPTSNDNSKKQCLPLTNQGIAKYLRHGCLQQDGVRVGKLQSNPSILETYTEPTRLLIMMANNRNKRIDRNY